MRHCHNLLETEGGESVEVAHADQAPVLPYMFVGAWGGCQGLATKVVPFLSPGHHDGE